MLVSSFNKKPRISGFCFPTHVTRAGCPPEGAQHFAGRHRHSKQRSVSWHLRLYEAQHLLAPFRLESPEGLQDVRLELPVIHLLAYLDEDRVDMGNERGTRHSRELPDGLQRPPHHTAALAASLEKCAADGGNQAREQRHNFIFASCTVSAEQVTPQARTARQSEANDAPQARGDRQGLANRVAQAQRQGIGQGGTNASRSTEKNRNVETEIEKI